MYLLNMTSDMLRSAVIENVPAVIPCGVIEYHGPHLPLGTDGIVPAGILDQVQKQCKCVALPLIPYGTTLTWAGDTHEGNMNFDSHVAYLYAKEIFKQLIQIGFRRIYVIQYHQGNGAQHNGLLMAASEVINELTSGWEPGWGRKEPFEWPMPNVFGLIQIMGLTAHEVYTGEDGMNIGHASRGETQLVMGIDESLVQMNKVNADSGKVAPWLADAYMANAQDGKRWIDFCIDAWVKELTRT